MKMNYYTLTIGLNDKDTKIQIIETQEAHNKLNNILLNNFNIYAFTMFDCFGCYKHDNGEIVQENSIRIEIANDVNISQDINILIRALKRVFNQESIMLETSIKNINFK